MTPAKKADPSGEKFPAGGRAAKEPAPAKKKGPGTRAPSSAGAAEPAKKAGTKATEGGKKAAKKR